MGVCRFVLFLPIYVYFRIPPGKDAIRRQLNATPDDPRIKTLPRNPSWPKGICCQLPRLRSEY